MPSARELLEQADALMRRNRGRNDVDIPVLTDVVGAMPANDEADNDVPLLNDVVGSSPAAAGALAASGASAASPRPQTEELLPAEVAPVQAAPAEGDRAAAPARPDSAAILRSVEALPVELPMEGDTSDWLVMDTVDPSTHSITGAGPDTLAVVPPVTLRAPETEPVLGGSVAPVALIDDAAERAAKAAEEERWRTLAEQVSMQVLQRVDLFTDTGLKTQLAEHLQPIVERASAELIRAITDHAGGVLRTYVAEAIEREIAEWKRHH
ncbi:MAG TPA: hypothetical protein VGK37_09540 [Casimicrobiaceae bacterium]|jgi:hypothetical protein